MFLFSPHLCCAVSVCGVSWEGEGCPDQQCSPQIRLSLGLLAWLGQQKSQGKWHVRYGVALCFNSFQSWFIFFFQHSSMFNKALCVFSHISPTTQWWGDGRQNYGKRLQGTCGKINLWRHYASHCNGTVGPQPRVQKVLQAKDCVIQEAGKHPYFHTYLQNQSCKKHLM